MEALDADGYPTDETLDRIVKWDYNDFESLLSFLNEIFWMPDWCIDMNRETDTLTLHTGGWSGNESIMEALERNNIFWMLFWKSSHRGGHYYFDLSPLRNLSKPTAEHQTDEPN